MQKIKIKYTHPNAKLTKPHPSDACWDAVAVAKNDLGYGRIQYKLGFSVELPRGTQLDMRPRSSIYKTGLSLCNSIVTGDEDYRGEYTVIFYHTVPTLPAYEVGDRVIQVQLVKKVPFIFEESESLTKTKRGVGGLGSSGK